MPGLDLLQRHLFASAAVVGLLSGGVVGLFLPIRAASPPKSVSAPWILPTIADTKRFRQDAYLSLRAARFWKTVAAPGERNAPRLDWSLAAIVTRPRPMAAVMQPGATQVSTLVAIGGQLPDGSTLVRVTRDVVWFEKDGCVRVRKLFRPVTAENNVCLGETAPQPTDPLGTAQATTSTSGGEASTPAPSRPTSSPTFKPSARPAPQGANSAIP